MQITSTPSGSFLALFDFDKVIFDGTSFFEVTKYLCDRGAADNSLFDKVMEEAAAYKSGSKVYKDSANSMLVAFGEYFEGKNVDDVYTLVKDYFDSHTEKIFPFTQELFQLLDRNDYDRYLVTTNFQLVAKYAIEKFGFKGAISTEFGIKDGQFTKEIITNVAQNKGLAKEFLDIYPKAQSIAFGDFENDIEMLELVDNPICVDPNEKLLETARKRNWHISSKDQLVDTVKKILGRA